MSLEYGEEVLAVIAESEQMSRCAIIKELAAGTPTSSVPVTIKVDMVTLESRSHNLGTCSTVNLRDILFFTHSSIFWKFGYDPELVGD